MRPYLTFSDLACGDAAPLLPAAAALLMVLILLASSRVKELTLILSADRLLAALPLPPLGAKPPNEGPPGGSPDP